MVSIFFFFYKFFIYSCETNHKIVIGICFFFLFFYEKSSVKSCALYLWLDIIHISFFIKVFSFKIVFFFFNIKTSLSFFPTVNSKDENRLQYYKSLLKILLYKRILSSSFSFFFTYKKNIILLIRDIYKFIDLLSRKTKKKFIPFVFFFTWLTAFFFFKQIVKDQTKKILLKTGNFFPFFLILCEIWSVKHDFFLCKFYFSKKKTTQDSNWIFFFFMHIDNTHTIIITQCSTRFSLYSRGIKGCQMGKTIAYFFFFSGLRWMEKYKKRMCIVCKCILFLYILYIKKIILIFFFFFCVHVLYIYIYIHRKIRDR